MIVFDVDTASADQAGTTEHLAAEQAGIMAMFSTLDIIIVTALAGFGIYWFFLRQKQSDEVPAIKKLTVVPAAAKSNDPSFINKMKASGRNVVVFYGSQTGTAEEFAGRLSKDATRYGMKGMVADPEECDMEELSKLAEIENSIAIFCMATYGEGDPTDNAQEFYDWLMNGGAELEGVKFAVFGLGNKTYEHYNAMGRFVDKKLEDAGAIRVCEAGEGDDDGNIEEDFVTWREKFWPAVCEFYGVTATGDEVSIRQYSVTVHEAATTEKIFTGEVARLGSFNNQKPPYDAKNPYLAPITVNRELHKGGDRSCMHIEIDISGSKIRYEAGDHVAVYPINDTASVEKLGQCLNIDLDTLFTLTNVDEDASKKHPFPCPCTYRTALLHYLDITCIPHKHILKELSEYTDDPKEKEFLNQISANTPEGKSLYSEWVVKDRRTILHILQDLPSIKAPIDHLCELLPRLQPRYYSIASSPKVHPTSIHITAILVEYTTRTRRQIKGVATTWLAKKLPSEESKSTVPVFVRKSQFRLPFKSATPVIMIGPGTGIAPFRGFIQERDFVRKEGMTGPSLAKFHLHFAHVAISALSETQFPENYAGKPLGATVLFTGCRNKAVDFVYEEELEQYKSDGSLSQLEVAFSRDQANKIYVQDLMKQNKEAFWKLLEAGSHIYVCGDARNMARDVHSTLVDIIKTYGEMSEEKAEEYIKRLQSKGRYSQDVWS